MFVLCLWDFNTILIKFNVCGVFIFIFTTVGVPCDPILYDDGIKYNINFLIYRPLICTSH